MGIFFGKEELENLRSLKHDLVDPVKSFTEEVYRDTVGDAGSFYADKARKAQRSAKLTQEKTKARMAAIRREQEEMKQRRNATMKRAAITLAVLALFAFVVISAALSAHAADQDTLSLGDACLSKNPPDYENAAAYFKRAGMNGDPEGYYRLAGLYEAGCLSVGDPCTDDLEALGRAQARKYYALAARGGYAPAQERLADTWQSIPQDEAKRLIMEDCVILDVRTREEYDEGHIPGAICVPVESITRPPELLPDYNKTVLVYCRSGRRSKQAAQKLASMGYTDIREFGGINDWTGDTVTAEEDTDFLAVTGLSKMASALKAGAVVEKAYYTEGYGFSTSEFTTTDSQEISALWDALCQIQLGRPSGMGITDWYPQIVFYLNNGQHFGARFEGRQLDIDRNYEIENAEDFWNLTKWLTEKYESGT